MMGQYHFMRWFINEDLLPRWLYNLIYIPGRLAAPFFLMISGISAVMFFNNYKNNHANVSKIYTSTLKRGLFLLCLTLPLNFAASYIFHSGTMWEWNIFQLLGISIMLTVFIGLWRLYFLIPSLIIVFLLYDTFPVSPFSVGIVPILPWLNYFFVGSIFGLVMYNYFQKNDKRFQHFNLMIMGLLSFTFVFIFLSLDGTPTVKSVLHHRASWRSMTIIAIFFASILILVEGVKRHSPNMSFLRNLGLVSLSVYYIHILYKYFIVTLLQICGQNNIKSHLGTVDWIIINAVFWIMLYIFIKHMWEPQRFIYGIEWFMSKYISQRSVITGEK